MRFKKILAMLAALVVLGAGAVADATTMLLLTREQLVERSEVVARVRVGKAVTGESEDRRAIVTRTEIQVTQLLKGKAPERLVIQQIGGSHNGKTQKILGDAALRPGEDAVVFLRRDDKGTAYLTALSLSVYHVDATGMARRELSGATLMRREGDKLEPTPVAEEPEPVEKLMTDIVRIAGGK
ncbi:hypothetical protein [Polyangium aurulentum]|uniref:hypothetical protein n=1 Tax=Polyangium aurulentum TaxID=2567896 RepID=UPI0010AEE9E7|nr:hypothetical protein [Polyangium aurulentum]UQA55731.1 hypothetical protein E8A73_030910 [Polyangium aurulentum]